MLTLNQFNQLFPRCYFEGEDLTRFYNGLVNGMYHYEIIGALREDYFLAQCAHESQGFSKLEENLNYTTPERLLKIFPKDFKGLEDAKKYAGNPEAIANRVYANQPGTGNGDEASGDGWRHRGIGPIQLTGRNNQTRFTHAFLLEFPENTSSCIEPVIMQPFACAYSAPWFWGDISGNYYADKQDFTGLTRRINGTSDPTRNNLADRLAWLEKISGAPN